MARRIRDASLETRSARLRLPVRKKPYPGPLLGRGTKQEYRRNRGAGSWVAKVANGHGGYWTKALPGVADDFEDADGQKILNFFQAQQAILALARGQSGETGGDRPITVEGALAAYELHLRAAGGDPNNARRPLVHLPPISFGGTGPSEASPTFQLLPR